MVSEIFRPKSVAEAARLAVAPGTAVLGGGTWLNSALHAGQTSASGSVPQSTGGTGARDASGAADSGGANGRPAAAADSTFALISLENLGLDFVEWRSSALRIGAAATFQQCLEAPGVPEAIRTAFAGTASRTLRNMATVGGELGLCPEDSLLIPLLAALDAQVRIAGRRPLTIEEYRAARAQGPVGLILEVSVPDADRPSGVAWHARTSHGMRSLVVAVAAHRLRPAVTGARIVASDCRGQVRRLADAEEALAYSPLPAKDRIEKLVRAAFWPTSHAHASTEFKRCLAGVYAADLLHALAERQAGR
jgi:putative selenate reductase FAD-binding subunit